MLVYSFLVSLFTYVDSVVVLFLYLVKFLFVFFPFLLLAALQDNEVLSSEDILHRTHFDYLESAVEELKTTIRCQ